MYYSCGRASETEEAIIEEEQLNALAALLQPHSRETVGSGADTVGENILQAFPTFASKPHRAALISALFVSVVVVSNVSATDDADRRGEGGAGAVDIRNGSSEREYLYA